MDPNDPNSPQIAPEPDTPAINSQAPPSPYPKDDGMFVVAPPPPRQLNKNSVILVAAVSAIGIILLIVVVIFGLIGSVTSLAHDYRRLASVQINKIDSSLQELEPSAVLSGRNLEAPAKAITQSEQSQPSLENVLFVGSWSDYYMQTAQLKQNVSSHYKNIIDYQNNLKKLIAFDSAVEEIMEQEPSVAATANPNDSLSIRSASGSYEDYAKTIEKQAASPQIHSLQKQLAKVYHAKAATYINWAKLVETGNNSGEAKAKSDLLTESGEAAILTEDQNYIDSFSPSYNKLLVEQKKLKIKLAQ